MLNDPNDEYARTLMVLCARLHQSVMRHYCELLVEYRNNDQLPLEPAERIRLFECVHAYEIGVLEGYATLLLPPYPSGSTVLMTSLAMAEQAQQYAFAGILDEDVDASASFFETLADLEADPEAMVARFRAEEAEISQALSHHTRGTDA